VLGGSCGSSQRQCGAARFSRASDDRALLCAVRRSGCGRYGSVRSGEGAFSAGFSHSGQRSAQSRYVQPLVSQSGPGSVSRFVSSQLQGVVAIDGKVVRRSFDRASGKSPLHMVSAWGSASMFPATMLPRAPDTTPSPREARRCCPAPATQRVWERSAAASTAARAGWGL
jgi:hypothetical protein